MSPALSAFLSYTVVQEAGITERETLESKPEGGERASHLDTQGSLQKENKTNTTNNKTASAKALRRRNSKRLSQCSGSSNRAADTGCGPSPQVQLQPWGLRGAAEGREEGGQLARWVEQQQEDLELEEGSRGGRGRRARRIFLSKAGVSRKYHVLEEVTRCDLLAHR